MDVTVRVAGEGDLDALADLRFEWRATDGTDAGLDRLAFRDSLRDWYASHRLSHVPFLAHDRGEAVGFAWLAIVERVPSPSGRRRAGMLQSVYVRAAERDRGVGTTLVGAMIEHARTLELEYLMVHPSARSFVFYRRLGFSDADRVLELRSYL